MAPPAGSAAGALARELAPLADGLLADLRDFMAKNFGFGDFVFKLADGTELGRAANFRELQECVARVNIQSLLFHAERNHFSNWLIARGEFDLARQLKPRRVSDFDKPEDLRAFLLESLSEFRHERQAGMVTDFKRELYDGTAEFLRIGEGSLGGKGRGLAFINKLFNNQLVCTAFPGTRISVPRTAVICTGAFDAFMEKNDLVEFALDEHSDEEIIAAFTNATLPFELEEDLKAYLALADYPLAVRSSSLLEDSYYQPFAGILDDCIDSGAAWYQEEPIRPYPAVNRQWRIWVVRVRDCIDNVEIVTQAATDQFHEMPA